MNEMVDITERKLESRRRLFKRVGAVAAGLFGTALLPKETLAYECFHCGYCYGRCLQARPYEPRTTYRCKRADGLCMDPCGTAPCYFGE